jgi:hypothetical protein
MRRSAAFVVTALVCAALGFVLGISTPAGAWTGREKTYHYPGGQLKLRERWIGEQVVKSTWYRPDGSVVASSALDDGAGFGLYLDDEGNVKKIMFYRDGFADGLAITIDSSTSQATISHYKEGRPAANAPAGP